MSRSAAAIEVDPRLVSRPRRWRPSAGIQGSVALHAAGLAAVALQPTTWPWVLGAVAANHAVLSASGFLPRSRVLGPNLRRLPAPAAARREIALTFDDGPDAEVTPRVLDCLDQHRARATFFVVGEQARRYPALVREMIRRGHAVENHTNRHSVHFPWYGRKRLLREIRDAQSAIADTCGIAPVYFRAPMGFRTPLLEPVLARLGLHLVSWTRRGFDTTARDDTAILRRLTRNLGPGDVLLLHDAVAVVRTRPRTLGYLPALLDRMATANLRSVTLRAACLDAVDS
jgi:peptidoglycan/xylan/chitin deacetylase (PgdA/CDA1 family)